MKNDNHDLKTVLIEILLNSLASSDTTFEVGKGLKCCSVCSMVNQHSLYCPWVIANALVNNEIDKIYSNELD